MHVLFLWNSCLSARGSLKNENVFRRILINSTTSWNSHINECTWQMWSIPSLRQIRTKTYTKRSHWYAMLNTIGDIHIPGIGLELACNWGSCAGTSLKTSCISLSCKQLSVQKHEKGIFTKLATHGCWTGMDQSLTQKLVHASPATRCSPCSSVSGCFAVDNWPDLLVFHSHYFTTLLQFFKNIT